MPRYFVTVTFTGSYSHSVKANSEDEAYEIATRDADVSMIDDWETDIETAESWED